MHIKVILAQHTSFFVIHDVSSEVGNNMCIYPGVSEVCITPSILIPSPAAVTGSCFLINSRQEVGNNTCMYPGVSEGCIPPTILIPGRDISSPACSVINSRKKPKFSPPVLQLCPLWWVNWNDLLLQLTCHIRLCQFRIFIGDQPFNILWEGWDFCYRQYFCLSFRTDELNSCNEGAAVLGVVFGGFFGGEGLQVVHYVQWTFIFSSIFWYKGLFWKCSQGPCRISYGWRHRSLFHISLCK